MQKLAATCSIPQIMTCRALSVYWAPPWGQMAVNIANFTLGRAAEGGQAIALLYVDAPVSDAVLADLQQTGKFSQVSRLEFDVS